MVEQKIPALQPDEVLVRRLYAGVNASDVNFSSGKYFGKPEVAEKMLPFSAGFESVGVVASVGYAVKGAFQPPSSLPSCVLASSLKLTKQVWTKFGQCSPPGLSV